MMRTTVRWFHLVMIPMLLTGCWDYIPLEERFIVNAVGIDVSDQRPREILVTVMGTTHQKNNETIQAEGGSISDAFHNIRNRTDKDLALSHIKMIIVSDQVASQGILPYLDVFYRDAQIRSDGLISIVTGKANDYMDEDKLSYPIDGAFMFDVINRSETVIDIHKYDIQNTLFDMISNNYHVTLPLIQYDAKQKMLVFAGLALLKAGKMVGQLGKRESLGLFMLNGSLKESRYTMGSWKFGQNDAKAVTFRLFTPKRKVKWKMNNGQPSIEYKFHYLDDILEIVPWRGQKMSESQFEQLELDIEKDIETLLADVIKTMQKTYRMEIFSLRNLARVKWRTGYKVERWDEQFAEIPIHVDVDVQIERTGLLY